MVNHIFHVQGSCCLNITKVGKCGDSFSKWNCLLQVLKESIRYFFNQLDVFSAESKYGVGNVYGFFFFFFFFHLENINNVLICRLHSITVWGLNKNKQISKQANKNVEHMLFKLPKISQDAIQLGKTSTI